jgi:hypothetical protein
MSDTRKRAHHLIDQLPEAQLLALVGFLETIVDNDEKPRVSIVLGTLGDQTKSQATIDLAELHGRT